MELSGDVVWGVVGLLLLIAEIFSGAFVLCFFGAAALIIAGAKALTGTENLAVEVAAFALLGIASLFLFREKLLRNFGRRSAGVALDSQKVVELTAALPARSAGKVEYQGTLWDAYNDSDMNLRAGDKAVVVGTQGIKLILKPIGGAP